MHEVVLRCLLRVSTVSREANSQSGLGSQCGINYVLIGDQVTATLSVNSCYNMCNIRPKHGPPELRYNKLKPFNYRDVSRVAFTHRRKC